MTKAIIISLELKYYNKFTIELNMNQNYFDSSRIVTICRTSFND
jgi:hypothetical protein